MVYTPPLTRVFQVTQRTPQAGVRARRTHISGGEAFLVRYFETDERPLGRLGYYDRLVEQAYTWPNRPAGAKVDQSYAKVYIRNALLKYFSDSAGSGASIQTEGSAGSNMLRSGTVNFKANGTTYPRNAAFNDRDVQVNDIVKVRALNDDSVTETVWTYVKDIIGDEVITSPAAATTDASNPNSQSASAPVTKIAGVENCVGVSASASSYAGLPSGFIDETYDIVVIEGSVNQDPTTAKLRIISASSTDDVDEFVPTGNFGVPQALGTRGATFTLTNAGGDCSASADAAEVSYLDLIPGQRWSVAVNGLFTKPVPTSGGTYTGDQSSQYIITVTKGGLWADEPEITVTTTNGYDTKAPVVVTAAATSVSVGNYGTTVQFSGNGLRKGDRYYIVVTGKVEGPMRTLVLGHSFSTLVPADTEVELTLFIKVQDLQIEKNQTDNPPNTNWQTSDTEITLTAGIEVFEASWTSSGTPLPLEVYSEESKDYGIAYVEYRAWTASHVGIIGSVDSIGDLDTTFTGKLHPDNPLKYGVYWALVNGGGQPVLFSGVANPDDVDAWVDVISLLLRRKDIFNLVPLTRNQDVRNLFIAHVNSASSPEKARWRSVWFGLEGIPAIPIISEGSDIFGHTAPTTSDEAPALCTITDDPDTSGSQYTILRVTSGNADLITLNVRAGDIVRALYSTDGFDNETYSEYTIDEVTAEDQCRLVAGPDAPINVAARFEIWRNLSASEEAEEVARQAGTFGNKRVRAVWPNYIESGTTRVESYFLAATLAGQTSGVVPQQGLTRAEVSGFTSVTRTTDRFNEEQLDVMAGGGAWIVTQDELTGQIFTRHAVTTGDTEDIVEREEMIVRNLDDISYTFQELYDPLIGVTNAVPDVQRRIREMGTDHIGSLERSFYSPDLGGQVVTGAIIEVRKDALDADKFVVEADLTLPAPLNNIDVRLNVTV
jgi:hypothetical protein